MTWYVCASFPPKRLLLKSILSRKSPYKNKKPPRDVRRQAGRALSTTIYGLPLYRYAEAQQSLFWSSEQVPRSTAIVDTVGCDGWWLQNEWYEGYLSFHRVFLVHVITQPKLRLNHVIPDLIAHDTESPLVHRRSPPFARFSVMCTQWILYSSTYQVVKL